MSKPLTDFARPVHDNGRGIFKSASADWLGGEEGYDYWLTELDALGIKWAKIVDENGNSLPLCEKLLAQGMFPIVQILRRDPPPNDTPEPNPGHIGPQEEETIRRLIKAGVRYFETNSEPNRVGQWKYGAKPGEGIELAKIVALNWLFDARFIIEAGGYPGLPAISSGADLDLIGALVALGRQDILLDGAWIALHNYGSNRPVNFSDDPVNRTAAALTPEEYDQGDYTDWAWWNASIARANTLEEVNEARKAGRNSVKSILQDHACFREFEYYNFVAMKYLGISVPILSTSGGYRIGCRDDARYPRVTPDMHKDLTVAMFEYVQRQAPDYYFVAMPGILVPTSGWEAEAWCSNHWRHALSTGTGRNGLPPIAVPQADFDYLPAVDAVKQMPRHARRLPGAQPAPPQPIELPASEPDVSGDTQEYVVQPGESLSIIARKFGTTWQSIAILNQIANPQMMRAGQALRVPSSPAEPEIPHVDAPAVKATQETEQEKADESVSQDPPAESPRKPRPQIERAQVSVAPHVFQIKSTRAAPRSTSQSPREQLDFPDIEVPAEVGWDQRLDAFNLGVYPVEVEKGKRFWKIVSAEYHPPEQVGEGHDLFFNVLDDQDRPVPNQRVWLGWRGKKIYSQTDADGQASISLTELYVGEELVSDLYFAGVDGLPSDRIAGVSLYLNRNETFELTWKRAVHR